MFDDAWLHLAELFGKKYIWLFVRYEGSHNKITEFTQNK